MICPNCNAGPLSETSSLTPWYYCTTCFSSYTLQELAENFNLDVADLLLPTLETLDPETYEPVWYSEAQRNREYQTVDEMFAGIGPMEDDKIDYGYPIGWGEA